MVPNSANKLGELLRGKEAGGGGVEGEKRGQGVVWLVSCEQRQKGIEGRQ